MVLGDVIDALAGQTVMQTKYTARRTGSQGFAAMLNFKQSSSMRGLTLTSFLVDGFAQRGQVT